MKIARVAALCTALLAACQQALAQGPAQVTTGPAATSTPGAARVEPAAPGPRTDAHGFTWVTIPAGTFEMGCVPGDDVCGVSESPRHRVRISRPFELMTTEVTLGQYRHLAAPLTQPEWNQEDRLPVVNVTWGEARAFCAAAGGRLPTEAEWEFAARGGRAGELYVWGHDTVPRVNGRAAANVADESVKSTYPYMTIFTGYDDGFALTAPVGSFPPNAYGLFDMAGNVWEWTADSFDPGYYAVSPAVDPVGPPLGDGRVVRGGSWYGDPRSLRISHRGGDDPVRRPYGDGVGFRCARDLSH
jgi:formylglycine-generating enzyme required for sulfatase activity